MTVCLPPPSASAYRLVDDLREPMGSPTVHRISMDELPFEQALLEKLGARGWGRVHHFRNYYNTPWGERSAAPLSPRALAAFTRFVQAAAFPPGKPPSVFLTDRGGLELCWEDAQGLARQVEFNSDAVEFYIAATGTEGTFALDAMEELVRVLVA